MSIQIVPNRKILKFAASSASPIADTVATALKNNIGSDKTDLSLPDCYQIQGSVISDVAGNLHIYQGFSKPDGTVVWTTVDVVAVSASTFSGGVFTTVTGNTKVKIDAVGEVCKADFTPSSTGTNNFYCGLWCR
jgi:hypothetical protein